MHFHIVSIIDFFFIYLLKKKIHLFLFVHQECVMNTIKIKKNYTPSLKPFYFLIDNNNKNNINK